MAGVPPRLFTLRNLIVPFRPDDDDAAGGGAPPPPPGVGGLLLISRKAVVVVCLSVCGALRWRPHTQPPHSTHARTQSPSRKAATCWDALKGDGPSCEETHL